MGSTIVNPRVEIKCVRLYFSEGILREENKGYFLSLIQKFRLSHHYAGTANIPFTSRPVFYAVSAPVNVPEGITPCPLTTPGAR
jgi:hypothetical protein